LAAKAPLTRTAECAEEDTQAAGRAAASSETPTSVTSAIIWRT